MNLQNNKAAGFRGMAEDLALISREVANLESTPQVEREEILTEAFVRAGFAKEHVTAGEIEIQINKLSKILEMYEDDEELLLKKTMNARIAIWAFCFVLFFSGVKMDFSFVESAIRSTLALTFGSLLTATLLYFWQKDFLEKLMNGESYNGQDKFPARILRSSDKPFRLRVFEQGLPVYPMRAAVSLLYLETGARIRGLWENGGEYSLICFFLWVVFGFLIFKTMQFVERKWFSRFFGLSLRRKT